jgi:BirA family biotin operon repressor/biotin-[acetyl-CoA-carboxylase] ligase
MPVFLRPVVRVETTTSTMDLLGRLVRDGARSGTTVVAGVQTNGRGRSGRAWTAPPGSALLMSVLVRTARPVGECGSLSLLVGLAVCRAVESLTEVRCEIKWPNDVRIVGRKVAGILVVSRATPSRRATDLLLGLGVNVSIPAEALPAGATSLHLYGTGRMSRDDVLARLDVELGRVIAAFEGGTLEPSIAEVNARLAMVGEDVVIQDGERVIEGRVNRVATDGSLVLDGADGCPIVVRAGEVTRGPRSIRS